MNIVLHLQKLAYIDHDILAYLECSAKSYKKKSHDEGGLVTRVLEKWAFGLQRSRLLAITHMPQFGRSTEVNVFVKQFFLFFHGG